MNAVRGLTLLFGECAKYLHARAAPLPDGTNPLRGGTPAEQDPRDLDKVALAGYLSGALYRVEMHHEGGSSMATMLRAYFSRAGLKNQSARLEAAIEEVQLQGLRIRGRKGKTATSDLYQRLLESGIRGYQEELALADR